MKMAQPKFIQLVTASQPTNIVDNGAGVVSAIIRTGVVVTHDYKKGNRVVLSFGEAGVAYEIETVNQLEDILAIHLRNKNFTEPAMKYCKEKGLKEITD